MPAYHILSIIVCIIFKENYAKILPVNYTWKVPEKGFKMNWVMYEESVVDKFKSNLLLMIFCLHIINYNS